MKYYYRDGHLYWNDDYGSTARKDQQVGFVHSYMMTGDGKYLHRLIWELHHGPIPKGMVVDHINQDSLDNRIENLRLLTTSQNHLNKSKSKGYSKTRNGKYRARIQYKGKIHLLGTHDTEEEAREAYLKQKEIFLNE